MEKCLKRDNVDARYVQGILEYFAKNKIYIGLHHLRVAAKRGHKEARFIYGVLLMSLGTTEKGKKYLKKLKNEHGVATLETIWSTIRTSLKGAELHMKKVYHQSQAKMIPEINCHQSAPITACPNCFHRRSSMSLSL
ncbi:unnamed protein product [Eruca vesicaria subsp. sativa]|uniref:At2g35280-like TPR domain-containing protein n=1 Tax=Eruca vesicaria subsp. sativa TaxID=29727 RepID=A0ABC8JL91_ERUVS|nr:unnamed protein product [Eruca vesicaria subsp. sativa]